MGSRKISNLVKDKTNLNRTFVMLFIYWSTIVGLVYSLGYPKDVKLTLLYKNGVILGFNMWASAMLLASLLVLIGICFSKYNLVRMGSVMNMILWIFATLTYWSIEAYFAVLNYSGPMVFVWFVIFWRATTLVQEHKIVLKLIKPEEER